MSTATVIESPIPADIKIAVATECAKALISEGWEGGGSSYDIGTYHGDAEALEERIGRKSTREERVSLEYQIRRVLDERLNAAE
jgi:hypothetical protein